jgi:uncharacterized membrane protein
MKKWLNAIMIFAVLGLIVAGYSLFHNQGFASGEFCSIGETFDCDVVNKGPYSKLFGVPVSLIGILGYAFLFAAAWLKKREPKDRMLTLMLVGPATVGLGFTLYLTALEAFVLHVWCLLCLTSQIMMALIFLSTLGVWYSERIKGKTLLEKISSHLQ